MLVGREGPGWRREATPFTPLYPLCAPASSPLPLFAALPLTACPGAARPARPGARRNRSGCQRCEAARLRHTCARPCRTLGWGWGGGDGTCIAVHASEAAAATRTTAVSARIQAKRHASPRPPGQPHLSSFAASSTMSTWGWGVASTQVHSDWVQGMALGVADARHTTTRSPALSNRTIMLQVHQAQVV